MAWTTPKTWTSEPLIASDMNTHIRDNLNALKDPPSGIYTIDESSDLALTSTSWADVDATEGKFQQTITTYGGLIVVGWTLPVGTSVDNNVALDVMIDGVAQGGTDGVWEKRVVLTASTVDDMLVGFRFFSGITAGSHVFKMRYKIGGGTLTIYRGAGTAAADVIGQFYVREMS